MVNLQAERVLVIDTSTSLSYVALFSRSKMLFLQKLPAGPSLSLMSAIAEALKQSNISVKDLNFIATATGPGSYTGLRVGVATAQALAFSLKIPLITFCSLKVFTPKEDGTFCTIFDAKSGGFYFIKGEKRGQNITYSSIPSLKSLPDVLSELSVVDFCISPEIAVIQERLKSPKIKQFIQGDIDSEHLFSLLQEQTPFSNMQKIELLYLT